MTYILSASVYVLYSADINIFYTLKNYVLEDFDSINISWLICHGAVNAKIIKCVRASAFRSLSYPKLS